VSFLAILQMSQRHDVDPVLLVGISSALSHNNRLRSGMKTSERSSTSNQSEGALLHLGHPQLKPLF
jgi:hypothetical protein